MLGDKTVIQIQIYGIGEICRKQSNGPLQLSVALELLERFKYNFPQIHGGTDWKYENCGKGSRDGVKWIPYLDSTYQTCIIGLLSPLFDAHAKTRQLLQFLYFFLNHLIFDAIFQPLMLRT